MNETLGTRRVRTRPADLFAEPMQYPAPHRIGYGIIAFVEFVDPEHLTPRIEDRQGMSRKPSAPIPPLGNHSNILVVLVAVEPLHEIIHLNLGPLDYLDEAPGLAQQDTGDSISEIITTPDFMYGGKNIRDITQRKS
nr:hypothetical protein [Maricaulis sp.]